MPLCGGLSNNCSSSRGPSAGSGGGSRGSQVALCSWRPKGCCQRGHLRLSTMTLAFHEVVTSYGVHTPCLPRRVSPADSMAAVLVSPQALSKAHIQRGEPISVDSHWRRTHR